MSNSDVKELTQEKQLIKEGKLEEAL